uniref:Tyrosine specific protein phosphatases domain-containing protein n=1 Tax=Eutreptiella gymnastica TaxID=73025 RepID=A0A7S4CTS7_9EUGL
MYMYFENASLKLLSLPKRLMDFCLTPILWWDRLEKERAIQLLPLTFRKHMLRLLFIPTLLWNYFLHLLQRDRRWWDKVDNTVILGACPMPWQVQKLAQMGVTGVVNCTDEYSGPIKQYTKAGIKQLRIPTMDFHVPSMQHIDMALQFIKGQDGMVYVHCKAGRGRAATVVACWLVSEQQLTPMEAQNKLKHIRPHISPSLWKRDVVKQTYEKRASRGSASETCHSILISEDMG